MMTPDRGNVSFSVAVLIISKYYADMRTCSFQDIGVKFLLNSFSIIINKFASPALSGLSVVSLFFSPLFVF